MTINQNQPSHLVYHVKESEGDSRNQWNKVGAMWPNQDDKGYNIVLDYQPINLTKSLSLCARVYTPKETQSQ